MVRVFYFMLFIFFISGCIRKEIERTDYTLQYENYVNNVSFPFDLSEFNFECKQDSFDLNFFQRSRKGLLGQKKDVYIWNMYQNLTLQSNNDRSLKKNIYDLSKDQVHYDIYCTGKILLNKHIDSYIFILKDKNTYSQYENWSSIIAVNLKNDRICSDVELSDFSIINNLNKNLRRTYRWQNNYLFQLNYFRTTKMYLYFESKVPDFNAFPHPPDEKENKVARFFETIKRKLLQTQVLYYSVFYIDDDGFVKTTHPEKDAKLIKSYLYENADWNASDLPRSTM